MRGAPGNPMFPPRKHPACSPHRRPFPRHRMRKVVAMCPCVRMARRRDPNSCPDAPRANPMARPCPHRPLPTDWRTRPCRGDRRPTTRTTRRRGGRRPRRISRHADRIPGGSPRRSRRRDAAVRSRPCRTMRPRTGAVGSSPPRRQIRRAGVARSRPHRRPPRAGNSVRPAHRRGATPTRAAAGRSPHRHRRRTRAVRTSCRRTPRRGRTTLPRRGSSRIPPCAVRLGNFRSNHRRNRHPFACGRAGQSAPAS